MKMEKLLLIALMLFIFVPASTSTNKQLEQTMQELERSQLGQSILETIQMQLEYGEPIENVIRIFEEIQAAIDQEQQKSREIHESFQSQCVKEIKNLKEVLNELNEQKMDIKLRLQTLQPQFAQLTLINQRKSHEHNMLIQEIDTVHNRQQRQLKQYEQNLDDIQEMLYHITEVNCYFWLKNQQFRFGKHSALTYREDQDQSIINFGNFLIYQCFRQEFQDPGAYYFKQKPTVSLMHISVKVHKMKKEINGQGFRYMFEMLSQLASRISDFKDDHELNLKNEDSFDESDIKKKFDIQSMVDSLVRQVLEVCSEISDYLTDMREFEVRQIKMKYCFRKMLKNQKKNHMNCKSSN